MQRGRPSGTATSAVPSRGTSVHPSKRAARAGHSAFKSEDDVKIPLSTSSGRKPLPSWRARNSSAVAFRIASRVLAAAVVAPRSPRRVLVMALADQLRLMVLTDAALLKGRDVVAERSEEHTSELQSHVNLVCRLLLEKKKKIQQCSDCRTASPCDVSCARAHYPISRFDC